ncbi:MAG: ATP synthase F0 subunit B [Phycisphaerae bacterium]|jgi:F-type H+-transporting ATPase subunit b
MNKKITAGLTILFAAAVVLGSEESGQSGQQGIFDGSMAEAIWAVIAFLVLLIVLGKVAWKPLLKALQKREDTIKEQLAAAENARLKAEKMLDEYKKREIELIEKVTIRAYQIEKDSIEKAGKEATIMKEHAISEINAAKDAACQQLWQHVGDMVLALGQEVIGRSITTDDNSRLISEATEKLRSEQSAEASQ